MLVATLEAMKRFWSTGSTRFRLEDFSPSCCPLFQDSYRQFKEADKNWNDLLPEISCALSFSYEPEDDLGTLSNLIVDLDESSTLLRLKASFRPVAAEMKLVFQEIEKLEATGKADAWSDKNFFRELKVRIEAGYKTTFQAQDPTQTKPHNTVEIERRSIEGILHCDFIWAQRGLDDETQQERKILGRSLGTFFSQRKQVDSPDDFDRLRERLAGTIEESSQKLEDALAVAIKDVVPTLAQFGLPAIYDPRAIPEVRLELDKLFTDMIALNYEGHSGFNLPESYSGLGTRNLILILMQLLLFLEAYKKKRPLPPVHLVFIEEPEVHLHPQMQEVFIRTIFNIKETFETEHGISWPVQIVLTTHSSHIANRAQLRSIRYVRPLIRPNCTQFRKSEVLDLGEPREGEKKEWVRFLNQYLTLTKCDLFFADKAIVIEGTSERIFLPAIIDRLEDPAKQTLQQQYITTIESGGHYAYVFLPLLRFIGVRTLVITDLDSVNAAREKCIVSAGVATSNSTLKQCFGKKIKPSELSISGNHVIEPGIRIAYQVPEKESGPTGRTLEDSFILANPDLFGISVSTSSSEQESEAAKKAAKYSKTDFALRYALPDRFEGDEEEEEEEDKPTAPWNIPRYLREGLEWLARD